MRIALPSRTGPFLFTKPMAFIGPTPGLHKSQTPTWSLTARCSTCRGAMCTFPSKPFRVAFTSGLPDFYLLLLRLLFLLDFFRVAFTSGLPDFYLLLLRLLFLLDFFLSIYCCMLFSFACSGNLSCLSLTPLCISLFIYQVFGVLLFALCYTSYFE